MACGRRNARRAQHGGHAREDTRRRPRRLTLATGYKRGTYCTRAQVSMRSGHVVNTRPPCTLRTPHAFEYVAVRSGPTPRTVKHVPHVDCVSHSVCPPVAVVRCASRAPSGRRGRKAGGWVDSRAHGHMFNCGVWAHVGPTVDWRVEMLRAFGPTRKCGRGAT